MFTPFYSLPSLDFSKLFTCCKLQWITNIFFRKKQKVRERGKKSKEDSKTTIRIGAKSSGVAVQNDTCTGDGAMLANSSIIQDKVYWEVEVVHKGSISVGFFPSKNIKSVLGLTYALVESNTNFHADSPYGWYMSLPDLQLHDIISIGLDQSTFPVRVNIWINGTALPITRVGEEVAAESNFSDQETNFSGLRGEVFPLIAVGNEAAVKVHFAAELCKYVEGLAVPLNLLPLMISRNII
eukprot:Platyproteum_vivax@DN5815_c0_g1_i5.p1